MKSVQDIRPISFIKSHASEILNQVNETHRPVYVTQNGEARAVLLDTESFQNMKNALGILKIIAIGENDIKNQKSKSQEEVFHQLEENLLAKKKK